MKRPRDLLALLALMGTGASPEAATLTEGWPGCRGEDGCSALYLNVTTRQGNATVSVDRACAASRRHTWRRRDARQVIVQWLDAAAGRARGSLCIPLHPEIDEIRITSAGGHCGEQAVPEIASASLPGGNAVLRRASGRPATVTLPGCHARIGNAQAGEMAYGGIALNFSDGYGFGDSYAAGHFYGVYDGFGGDSVRPFGASVYAISEFNTYHYRVEILAHGRDDWMWDTREDNGR